MAPRWVANTTCTFCQTDYYSTPEWKEWFRAHGRLPSQLERERQYQKTKVAREWRKAYEQREEIKEKRRKYERNPGPRALSSAHEASRRALKLKAIPSWLTAEQKAAIVALYAEAQRLTRETGEPYHVDHDVPLQSRCPRTRERNACGLHVPANLKVIKGIDNLSKGCFFDDWS